MKIRGGKIIVVNSAAKHSGSVEANLSSFVRGADTSAAEAFYDAMVYACLPRTAAIPEKLQTASDAVEYFNIQ